MEVIQTNSFSIAIIWQNQDFLVIDKPNNLSVQENKDYSESLEKILKEQISSLGFLPRSGIVHRLDRQTTGLLLVAKNLKAFAYLSSLFKKRQIHKGYLSLVWGNLPNASGKITFYQEKQFLATRKVRMKINEQRGKLVEISFRVLERLTGFSFLIIFPLTGRTHQIRLAFQKITHPIYNDPVYNNSLEENSGVGQYLHAYSLEFDWRDGKKFSFYSPLPDFFQQKLKELGSQEGKKYYSPENKKHIK